MKKVTKLTAVLMAAMLVWLFASCSSEDSGSGSEPQPAPTEKTVTLSGITVTGAPSKVLYFPGEDFDGTGLAVTATYSDGTSKTVTGWTTSGFTSENIGIDGKLLISYTEDNITRTATTPYYVASLDAKPTESPVVLTDYMGTLEGGTYYKFGDFPQTVAASSVKFSDAPVYKDYYLGSDGYFYAKCSERAYYSNYHYSDGTSVKYFGTTEKYFKVEPIKWRVLNLNTSENKILLAENVLTGYVCCYGSSLERTLGEQTIYGNNYKYSNIRAYLNGTANQFVTDGGAATASDIDWTGKGFLQTAFTAGAQSLIEVTTVDNSVASTNPASDPSYFNDEINEYVCEDTEDKIFLLSVKEVTTSDYGFKEKIYYEGGNSRIRLPTDYAKANHVRQSENNGEGGYWRLRSPSYYYKSYSYAVTAESNVDDFPCGFSEYGIVPACHS